MSDPRKVAGYGWRPQLPDIRDARLALPAVTSLPTSVDLSASPDMPPVYDQGQLGSCTANAIAAAVDFQNHRQDQEWLTPSRLWIYYQERVIEGTVSEDAGAEIRDGMKAVAKLGVCPETDWPYDIDTFAQKPPRKDYKDALKDKVVAYESAPQELFGLKSVLASGLPVVFGFTVYESFEGPEVAKSGILPMPAPERVDRRRARRDDGRLRRRQGPLQGAQLLGHVVGSGRLLRNALPVRDQHQAGDGLLGRADAPASPTGRQLRGSCRPLLRGG